MRFCPEKGRITIPMKSICGYGIIIFFILITLVLQSSLLDKRFTYTFNNPFCSWCKDNESDEVRYIPADSILVRLFAPADPDFLADLLWLRTQYYFGSHVVTDQDYFYLYYLLDRITDLSPRWEYPYIFGAILLPSEANMPIQALSLIAKGIKFHDNSWRLIFLRAYIYWENLGDYERAAKEIFKASQLPESPEYFAPLSVTLAKKTGDKEFSYAFAKIVLSSLKDPLQKQIIQKKFSGDSKD